MSGVVTRQRKARLFWAGWVGSLAVTSLMQDFIGKDDYLRMARDGWVTPWVSVPAALALLAWSIKGWRDA